MQWFRTSERLGRDSGLTYFYSRSFFIVMRWLIDRGVITTPHTITLSWKYVCDFNLAIQKTKTFVWSNLDPNGRKSAPCGASLFVNTLPLEFSSQTFTQYYCLVSLCFFYTFLGLFPKKRKKILVASFFLWVRSKYFWLVR